MRGMESRLGRVEADVLNRWGDPASQNRVERQRVEGLVAGLAGYGIDVANPDFRADLARYFRMAGRPVAAQIAESLDPAELRAVAVTTTQTKGVNENEGHGVPYRTT